MAVPKKKTSKTKKRMRRSHHALSLSQFASCKKCGARILQHVACPECGTYKGRSVLDVRTSKEKRAEKAKKRTKKTKPATDKK